MKDGKEGADWMEAAHYFFAYRDATEDILLIDFQ